MSEAIAWLGDPWTPSASDGDAVQLADGDSASRAGGNSASRGGGNVMPQADGNGSALAAGSTAQPAHSGVWGAPAALALPLDDRGLLLADGLFETLLVEAGRPWRLQEHLARWRAAAELLALPPPPTPEGLLALLAAAVARSGAATGVWRLNVSRGGGGGRGLDPPTAPGAAPRFWFSYSPGAPCFEPIRLVLSRLETRNASSLLSRCKTFAYGGSLVARREARARGADDALLASSAGGLCCASAANLLVRLDGRWRTPPLSSGCLPGILRGLALARGLVVEQALSADDLRGAEAALLINSLGCRPVLAFEGTALPEPSSRQAEAMWRELLQRGSNGGEPRPAS